MTTNRSFARFKKFKYFTHTLILIGLILLYLLVQWIVGAFRQPGQMGLLESQTMEMTIQPPEGVMPVETETVSGQPFDSSVTYTGSAVAFNDIPVFPRTQGWIQALSVYPGDRVHQGQLLVQLDTRELSSRVNEARFAQEAARKSSSAALRTQAQAAAQAKRAEQAIQTARANLDYWHNEINRARTLVKEEVITVEEFQREQSQFEAAQSQYNQALSELRAASQGAEAAYFQASSQQFQSRQAAATTRTQQIIRSYTSVTAPMSGVILERMVPPGTLVSPGMQILRMAQINPIRIQAYVAQKDWERIRVGDPVRIWQAKNQPHSPVVATVTAVFPTANLQSRTAIVEAVVPNHKEQFIPGDYIRMAIVTGHKENVLTVPNSALVSLNQQQVVWVVQDGKAVPRYVTTGDTNGSRTEVVAGLKPGDVVITQGNRDLQSGVPVVSAKYGPDGVQTLPKILATNRLVTSNGYKVTYPVQDLKLTVEVLKKPPVAGDNPVSFTFAATPMGTMEMPVPADLEIEVKTVMPAMPTMPSPKPNIQKVSQEQFKGTVNFGMPGLWQMEVTIKEKGKPVATKKFEVEVPE